MTATSTPCIFFQQGRCRNGDACRFSHTSTPASITTHTHGRPDTRSQVPCKFYREGKCKQGTNCPYRHELSNTPASTPRLPQHGNDTFVRVFGGALVRYGDGACVTNLSLSSEYSSVRLDGLAADTTATDVISILETLGHDIEVDGLRIVPMPKSPKSLCSAYISTPDLEFPKTLDASLTGTPYFFHLTAVPVPPRFPPWASTRRVRCNKVKLRWSSPYSEAIVLFETYATALRVSNKFNNGKYVVNDTHIHGDEPMVGPLDGLWSVKLSGLPYRCNAEMVEDSITATHDLPLHVKVQRRHAWKRNTATSIREFLNGIGPIDHITEPYELAHKYTLASAYFERDCDAQEAVRVIEKKSYDLPYDVSLTAKMMYSSTFKVSNKVYDHMERRLQDYFDGLDAVRVSVTCRDTGRIVGLESENSKELAKCADEFEDIVAGIVVEGEDNKPFWVPQLASNGPESRVLRDIQQWYKVLLLPNRSKGEVRYFGDSRKLKAVQEDLVESLTETVVESSTKSMGKRHTIDLDNNGFTWLCKDGLGLFKTAVGDKVASLNVTSNPKQLVITGSDEEYGQILALLETNSISFTIKEAKKSAEEEEDDEEDEEEEICTICLTPADDPVVLGCGHTYCTDCFKGLCLNGTTRTDVRVACTGAEDKCKNAIPLREIQAHVDASTFEQLLESSFSTYIARRPDQFHHCPTPDCGYIYRPVPSGASASSSSWHMCPKCLQRVCRSCHTYHDSRRCDEHKALQAFEAYKRENSASVKDCPKCGTTVEKTGGCNHIQCGGCHVHLCWACLTAFEESRACYEHMSNVHGGIGDEDILEEMGEEEDEEDEEEEEDEEDEEDDDEILGVNAWEMLALAIRARDEEELGQI